MSGFAHVTGQPDGPPSLPPFFLADGVAPQSATAAVMLALYHRDMHGGGGQLIDVNLIEPLARLIESSTLAYSQLGISHAAASATASDASAPRNCYRTRDGHWVAISSASPDIALRVFRSIGRPDMADDPGYADPVERQARAIEIDALVAEWIAARTMAEVMDTFERPRWRAAPVYDADNCWLTSTCGAGHLRTDRRPGPRSDDRAGAGGALQRDAGDHRAPRPGPRGRQRRGLRWPARRRRPAPAAELRAAGTI